MADIVRIDYRDIVEIIRPHRLTPDHACVGISAVHLRTAADTIKSQRKEIERLRVFQDLMVKLMNHANNLCRTTQDFQHCDAPPVVYARSKVIEGIEEINAQDGGTPQPPDKKAARKEQDRKWMEEHGWGDEG